MMASVAVVAWSEKQFEIDNVISMVFPGMFFLIALVFLVLPVDLYKVFLNRITGNNRCHTQGIGNTLSIGAGTRYGEGKGRDEQYIFHFTLRFWIYV